MEPIVIGRDSFRLYWELLHNTNTPEVHTKRAQQLRETYGCFRTRVPESSHERRGGGRGHFRNRRDQGGNSGPSAMDFPTAGSMRPRIGLLFTNKDEKARKNFVAFMNKLSPQNKDGILPNFIRSLVPENIFIYMEQIVRLFQVQPTYHDLYMEVLHHILAVSPEAAIGFLEEQFQRFRTEKGYAVPEGMLEGVDPEAQEDSFCEYTKWKKHTKSLLVMYVRLLAHHVFGSEDSIGLLLGDLGSTCEENWQDAVMIDIYLDMTLSSVQAVSQYVSQGIHGFPALVHQYREWDKRKDPLAPSSRFKVLDIVGCVQSHSQAQARNAPAPGVPHGHGKRHTPKK